MSKTRTALEFKGRMLSLTRVRILEAELSPIEAQLKSFTKSLGEAASGLPLLLDADQAIDLAPVLRVFRDADLQPLAVMEGALSESASALGLAVLSEDSMHEGGARQTRSASAQMEKAEPTAPSAPAEAPPPVERKPARVVTEPVRSGQQIYADQADLIVMSTVSAGAEIIADGCIHVYGSLRGRAVAGAKGDRQARVFCRKMESELLAVAGVYAVAEQIPGDLKGLAAQAYLEGDQLRIEKLEGN